MPKISVIIPIYNVENYFSKCLNSVINQTYKNIEIICVNDCSTDNSINILEQYAKKDNRIKLINQEKNRGLSAARNTGLDFATGEYIYFLDSDDWIDKNYIETMLNVAMNKNIDIVLNTNILAEYDTETKPYIWPNYRQILPQGEFLDSVNAINNTQCMVWSHLYKKSFLTKYHLRFPEGLIHEDVYFQHISKINTKQIFAFYGPSYHYRQRNNSITSCSQNKIYNLVKIFELSYEFYQKNNLLNLDVKLIHPVAICHFNTEEDFLKIQQLFHKLSGHLNKKINLYNNYEKFIIEVISNAKSYDEYYKITKNNIHVYYIRQKLLKK